MIKHSIAGLAERKGRYFLAKRKPGGDLGCKWELPGGKLEEGESPVEAMEREWLEELELPVKTGELLSEGTFFHRDKEFRLHMYEVEFNAEPHVFHEHTECGWFSPVEINSMDIAESDRIVLSACFDEIDPPR